MDTITHDVIPYESTNDTMRYSMVLPLAAPREAAAAISAYEALKAAVVRPDDVQKIQGRDFLKKSFWRRIATCFGLTLDLVSEQRGFDESGKLFYSVLYKAVAPNGRSMIGDGYCSTAESGRGGWPEHNVRATAHTRAKNRAISDLVGGGEVSAEEMPEEEPERRPVPMKQGYAKMAALPEPVEDIDDSIWPTWDQLREQAADLGISPADYQKAKRTYNTRAKMGEALKRKQEEQQPAVEAAPDPTEESAWRSLHARFAQMRGTTLPQWEHLRGEVAKGDFEVALKFVEEMEKSDLSKLPKAAGVH